MTTSSTSIIKKLLLMFLIFAGLYFAKAFFIPLSIGAVLATLLLPFCKWLEHKNVPRILASFICLLVLLLGISSIGVLLGWQVSELTNDISLLKQKTIETAGRIQQYILNDMGISVQIQSKIFNDQKSSIAGIIPLMAGSLLYIFTSFILTLVYIFLLLYYRIHIKQFILKLFPPAQQTEMELVIYGATHISQQYLLGLAKMIVCLWILYGIGFSIVGIENALFFAVLCGLLEIIPFIGNIIGTIITVLVAVVNGGGLPMVEGIIITYAVVQLTQGWVLEPLILGPQVKINPLFTIIALVLGELIWGIPGIILAIPLTAMVKIICDHIESLKPYGFLIGEIETKKAGPTFIESIKNKFK